MLLTIQLLGAAITWTLVILFAKMDELAAKRLLPVRANTGRALRQRAHSRSKLARLQLAFIFPATLNSLFLSARHRAKHTRLLLPERVHQNARPIQIDAYLRHQLDLAVYGVHAFPSLFDGQQVEVSDRFGAIEVSGLLGFANCLPLRSRTTFWRTFFHYCDRATIYVFIASSYTPW